MLENAEILGTLERSVSPRKREGRKGGGGGAHRTSRVMRLLCVAAVVDYAIIHLSELIEEVNPNQAERLGAGDICLLRKCGHSSLRSKCQHLGRVVCNLLS